MILLLTGCNESSSEQESTTGEGQGFSLPDGDGENGQLVFIEYQCIQCHTLAGTEFGGDEWQLQGGRETVVEIGGDATKLQTYADLVTSIINPSHRLAEGYTAEAITRNGKSKMLNYNDVMRVSELIDLVTFLKSKYELQSVPLTVYPGYILK